MTNTSNINEKSTTKAFRTLDQVVASVMNEMEDYNKQNRLRLLQFAYEGIRVFNLHHTVSFERDWIKVDRRLNTVPLPDQMLEFLEVAVPINGKLWAFTEIKDGITPEPGARKLNEERQEGEIRRESSYYSYGTTNFAFEGGSNDFQFIYEDEQRRLSLFTRYRIDEVAVTYKSTGIKSSGDTIVPIHVFEALKAYVYWKHVQKNRTYNRVEKMDAKLDYEEQVIYMRQSENMFTPNKFLDAIRSGYAQTYKR